MFDPLNIRYATDTTNMQLWNTHNPFRACLLCADGHMVMWEYKNSPFLVTFNPLVEELRSGASFFYNSTGDRGDEAAARLCRAGRRGDARPCRHQPAAGGGQDHGPRPARAGSASAFTVMEGEEVTERTRAIKGPDEILAMRCAHHACEAAIAEMEAFTRDERAEGRRVRRRRSGPNCTPATSAAAANGSRRGFWPRARAPTRGFRNAARGSCRTTKSWPSTPT